MSLQAPLCDSMSKSAQSQSIVQNRVQQIESQGAPLALPSPRGLPIAMAPLNLAALPPPNQPPPEIQQQSSSAIPAHEVPLEFSPESSGDVCMNMEEELTKMLDENGIAVPPGTAVNPDSALDMLLAQNQAGRRARSASRTPPNPQARMRALSQGTLPNRPIVPGNQGPQSSQAIEIGRAHV